MASQQTQEPAVAPAVAAEPQHEAHLEVDDTLEEADSVIDGSEGSSSYLSSLKSSIYNYRYENGRRYHAFREGTYILPNDEEEQDRMDLVHHIYSLLLDGKLYLAPISKSPQRILDLGTGTGIWAMDAADEHQSAEVIGTDLSPIQPQWTPPNCVFEVDDFEDDWVYKKQFDFIHGRELEGCISDDLLLFQRVFKSLVPNGYIEFQGVEARFVSDDGTLEKATNAQQWMQTLRDASVKFGKPLNSAPSWKDKVIEAGFVDVKHEVRKLPIGAWPKDPKLKEIGRYQSIQELQVVDSYTPQLFSQVLGWNIEEIRVFMAKVKKELQDPSIHLYLPVHFVWGRKPEQ
ncbi:hypothetical protein NCS57_00505100 [Fusarium keratoplasticum]|nr:hypothetical protein NCS57_00505100 [Fusarium keratoplasticum]KAI8664635.1 hypothetical protein NCS55_00973300 [Fusarium keratoplasticum]KAI8676019.1 hypothetical protein NCS57_00505100 [Fusarium keratoplasticum]